MAFGVREHLRDLAYSLQRYGWCCPYMQSCPPAVSRLPLTLLCRASVWHSRLTMTIAMAPVTAMTMRTVSVAVHCRA